MTWVKLDDQFFGHPKALAAGKDGRSLFIAGLCYSGANLTDGRIPKSAVPLVAAMAAVPAATAKKVVAAGLWKDTSDSYEIHDYLAYQPSRSDVEAHRTILSEKKAQAGRKGAAARWGNRELPLDDGKPDGKAIAEQWQSDSSTMAQVPSGENGKPVAPSHPIPSPSSSSSPSDTSARAPAEPEEEIWTLLARRRAALLQTQDGDVRGPRWITVTAADHATRLEPRRRLLAGQHPDWTVERLADELDTDTAERDWSQPTAEETDAYLADLEQRAAEAVPMPDDIRADLMQRIGKSTHRRRVAGE